MAAFQEKISKEKVLKNNLLFIIFCLFLTGCATFHHKPLKCSMKFSDNDSLLKVSNIITPKKAAILSLLYNPNLKIERARYSIEKSILIEAGLFSNPELDTNIQIPSGGSTSGTVNAYDIGLSWGINKLWTKNLYKKSSIIKREQINMEIAWKEWLIAEQARLVTYELFILNNKIRETEKIKNFIFKYKLDAEINVNSGLVSKSSFYSIQTDYFKIKEFLHNLKADYIKKETILKRLIGYPTDRRLKLSEKIKIPKNIKFSAYNQLIKAIKSRLDIAALKKAYKSNELMLQASIREQFPDIVISFTQSKDNDNLYTMGPGISISLPIFNHNQGKIKALRAKREEIFYEYNYRIYTSEMNIYKIFKLMQQNRDRFDLTVQRLVMLNKQIKEYKKAINIGECENSQLFILENKIFKKKIELLSLNSSYVRLLIGIELETGKGVINEKKF
jgi:hypothetical protein